MAEQLSRSEADFIRGRDIALAMVREGRELVGECECYRHGRKCGRPQDNFVNGYLSDILEEPALREGFASILSNLLGTGEAIDLEYFDDLTLAEIKTGEPGADGTCASDEPESAAAVQAAPNGHAPDAYVAICQARSVAQTVADDSATDAMWGLYSLIEKAVDKVESATNAGHGSRGAKELHDEASDELAGVLGILHAVDAVLDGNHAERLGAVGTLVALAKARIDEPFAPQEKGKL